MREEKTTSASPDPSDRPLHRSLVPGSVDRRQPAANQMRFIVPQKPESCGFRFAGPTINGPPGPPVDRFQTDASESENKSAADIITWREYEALRNEMRREFRAQDDELKGTVQEISQKLDATHVTVTTMRDQMTDVQRSLANLRLAVENLTAQQQQDDDDDPELQDDAHNARGVKTVDEYYMEMEMLMQRGRVRESLEMTMLLSGLNKDQRTSYRSWAFHTPRGSIYGAGAFDTLRPLLYST
ncbi:hypothetical protein QYE76_005648 [Lolium multiflorum]|uniref:Uncharacterized protein n=1 Tax=Lolium multiflorum TaxID=4521 RepID=A0AAD8RT50_LOLMU|nr:hypothetical protein QYE76_005648 [Lolium multiflorum]